jgi:prephenate dehydratase
VTGGPDEPALRGAGYLGPQGTFSEQALLASARADAVLPVPLGSIAQAIEEVAAGRLRWAVVPIENALEGSVAATLDTLAAAEGSVQIAGEALLGVAHALIASHEVELAQIEQVLTHPQVPGQCSAFLHAELPAARIVPSSSTAEAVREVAADQRPGRAAIGTTLAAELYGAVVLREHVEDRHDNETRFVWLRRHADDTPVPLRAAGGDQRTALVFWGSGADSPGWLLRCLQEFAGREVNLTKIESRPRPGRIGSYMFFAECAGDAADAPVAQALDALGAICEVVLVLGSYAAAANIA